MAKTCDICGGEAGIGSLFTKDRKNICYSCVKASKIKGDLIKQRTLDFIQRKLDYEKSRAAETAEMRELLVSFKPTRRLDFALAIDDIGKRVALKSVTSLTGNEPINWQIIHFANLLDAEVMQADNYVVVRVTASSGTSPLFIPLWFSGSGAAVPATIVFGFVGYVASKSANEPTAGVVIAAAARGAAIVDALKSVIPAPVELPEESTDLAANIERWHNLLLAGVISEEEFAQVKAKIIASL
jgi:hypothetical protein